MDIGEEEKVHEVRPQQNPYEGDEVEPEREKSEPAKEPARKEEKEKVGT